MNTNLLATMAIVALSIVAIGCTTGSGAVASETRDVGAFTRIDAGGGIGVTVTIAPAGPLTLTAQDDVRPLIATEVVDGTLKIHATKSYTTTAEVVVAVTMPSVESLTTSGGSAIEIADLAGDALTLDLTGGSRVHLTGAVDTIDLSASGGSRAEIDGLTATSITVDLTGGSVASVRATDEVSGSAGGGSRVTVHGDAQLNVESTGGSTVNRG